MKRTHLLITFIVCAALYAGNRLTLRITPAHPGIGAQIDGSITEGGGWFQGEPFVTAEPVRAWGTWNGADTHTGTLSLGPFPGPPRLRFAVGGYPTRDGNALAVELIATKERLPVTLPSDIGERWRIIEVDLPAGWIGRPVSLVAIDRAIAPGGWLAITEPLPRKPAR